MAKFQTLGNQTYPDYNFRKRLGSISVVLPKATEINNDKCFIALNLSQLKSSLHTVDFETFDCYFVDQDQVVI